MNILPGLFGILGLFAGRRVAARYGLCPHRGKVWGACLCPLLLLLPMMGRAPLIFFVSMGAALGAGLTAHASIKRSLLATMVGVGLATAVAMLTLL